MSIPDSVFSHVRQTIAYRASLWMMRLEFLGLLAFLTLLTFAPATRWLAGALFWASVGFAAAAIILLHRAGYPVLRMRASLPRDRRSSRMVYRDILLYWRSPSRKR